MEYTDLIPPKNTLLVEILSYYKVNGDTVSEVKKSMSTLYSKNRMFNHFKNTKLTDLPIPRALLESL